MALVQEPHNIPEQNEILSNEGNPIEQGMLSNAEQGHNNILSHPTQNLEPSADSTELAGKSKKTMLIGGAAGLAAIVGIGIGAALFGGNSKSDAQAELAEVESERPYESIPPTTTDTIYMPPKESAKENTEPANPDRIPAAILVRTDTTPKDRSLVALYNQLEYVVNGYQKNRVYYLTNNQQMISKFNHLIDETTAWEMANEYALNWDFEITEIMDMTDNANGTVTFNYKVKPTNVLIRNARIDHDLTSTMTTTVGVIKMRANDIDPPTESYVFVSGDVPGDLIKSY